jgi:2-polyprenyl-3-methyl-5-hydroxy-6-metoxy-1,4-benzoquinol methylase
MPSDIEFIDIGCGVGAQSEHLARLGFKVRGFDVSDVAIKRARERCSRAKLQDNASFFTVNPGDFQIKSSFDMAIACASLDSMPFDSAADWIQKAGSVIKENGFLFSTLIGPSSTNSALSEEVISNELHEKGTVQSYFTESKILKLLECGGFHPQRIDLIETTSIFPANKEARSAKRYSVVAYKMPARS